MNGTLRNATSRVTVTALVLIVGAILAWPPAAAFALGGSRPITVSVEGEVRRPGAFTLPTGATLSSLLLAAGGATDNANLPGATLTRESAKAAQGAELRGIVERLSRARAEKPGGAEAWRAFLEGLSALPPLGRVPTPLSHPRLLKGSPKDLPLEEGDVLRIPGRKGTVTVYGAVRAAGRVTLPQAPDGSADEYVRRAGGYREDADRGHLYLLRQDGTVVPQSSGRIVWNPDASRWEIPALTGRGTPIGPGDTIFVPGKPSPGSRAASVRDFHELLMRAAAITGVVPEIP